jgi:3-hydroxybutyryl-CoA dehydrogenase
MIDTICVCGAGTMGAGIAGLLIRHKYRTILYDVDRQAPELASQDIRQRLSGLVAKNKITTDECDQAMAQLICTSDLNDCIADLVIEAIVESVPKKISLFNQLAEINHSDTIFATNTSSLSVAEIAKGVMHPERVAGMHFFNPATIMKLVEIVRAPQTTEAVVELLIQLAGALNKTAVTCRDSPGFIVNRVARPFYLRALALAEDKVATMTEIDLLMEASGFRMGPFRLMDLIGNDINYAVSESLYKALGKPARLLPSLMQQSMVASGRLGKKTGKGYYDYPSGT